MEENQVLFMLSTPKQSSDTHIVDNFTSNVQC